MNCNDFPFRQLPAWQQQAQTRRTFLQRSGAGLGLAALGWLTRPSSAQTPATPAEPRPFFNGVPKAKRIIYLH